MSNATATAMLMGLADESHVLQVILPDKNVAYSLVDLISQFCGYTTKCGKHEVEFLTSDGFEASDDVTKLIQFQIVPTKGRPMIVPAITKEGLAALISIVQSNRITSKTRFLSMLRSGDTTARDGGSNSRMSGKRTIREEVEEEADDTPFRGDDLTPINAMFDKWVVPAQFMMDKYGWMNGVACKVMACGTKLYLILDLLQNIGGYDRSQATCPSWPLMLAGGNGGILKRLIHVCRMKGSNVDCVTAAGAHRLVMILFNRFNYHKHHWVLDGGKPGPCDGFTPYIPFHPKPKVPLPDSGWLPPGPIPRGKLNWTTGNAWETLEAKRRHDTGYYDGPYIQSVDMKWFEVPWKLPSDSKGELGFIFITHVEGVTFRIGLVKKDFDNALAKLKERLVCFSPTHYGPWYRQELWDRYKATRNFKECLITLPEKYLVSYFLRFIEYRHWGADSWGAELIEMFQNASAAGGGGDAITTTTTPPPPPPLPTGEVLG